MTIWDKIRMIAEKDMKREERFIENNKFSSKFGSSTGSRIKQAENSIRTCKEIIEYVDGLQHSYNPYEDKYFVQDDWVSESKRRDYRKQRRAR